MNPQDQIPKPTNSLEELDMDSTSSVDDFIRELEAKEKDLHITADMSIEIILAYSIRVGPRTLNVPTAVLLPIR